MTATPRVLTITVGIPAHNEEKTILPLLDSVLHQEGSNFNIEKIVVILDGCTDTTAAKVKALQKKHDKITIINDGKRTGKALRLNQIYALNRSEALLTLDADVRFASSNELEKLCRALLTNKNALLVGPRYVPVQTNTFVGQCAVYSYLSFENSILQYNAGQNIFALMGCCSLIRSSLVKEIRYPAGTISDQNYLYLSALAKNKNAFVFEKDASVLFKTVTTLADWWILSARSVRGDREDAVSRFGEKIRELYSMPRKLYFRSLLTFLFRSPVYTLGAIALNILIRVFPYQTAISAPGIWQTTHSSKTTY